MTKTSQLFLKMIVSLNIFLLGIIFYCYSKKLLLIWLIALTAGFVLHRSGICLSSAFSDLILFRNYKMAQSLLIFIIVSLVGISILQFYSFIHGDIIPGRFASFGIHSIVGSFLFGLGMVFAGACGCGTLQRLGDGSLLHLFVLISIVTGSVMGAYHFSWWSTNFIKFDPVYLPKLLGWPWGILISLTFLGLFYLLTLIAEDNQSSILKGWGKWVKKG